VSKSVARVWVGRTRGTLLDGAFCEAKYRKLWQSGSDLLNPDDF